MLIYTGANALLHLNLKSYPKPNPVQKCISTIPNIRIEALALAFISVKLYIYIVLFSFIIRSAASRRFELVSHHGASCTRGFSSVGLA